jgi:hypothetical protein
LSLTYAPKAFRLWSLSKNGWTGHFALPARESMLGMETASVFAFLFWCFSVSHANEACCKQECIHRWRAPLSPWVGLMGLRMVSTPGRS